MIYLCSVYSLNLDNLPEKEHKALMEARFNYASKVTAQLLNEGYCVMSPIAHCHPLSENHDLPATWDFWEALDYKYIDAAEQVWVLEMPNWMQSVGITAEIRYARSLGKPISYVPCDNFGSTEGLE